MSRKELTEIEKTVQKRIATLIYEEYKNNVSEFARCMGYEVSNCHAWVMVDVLFQ